MSETAVKRTVYDRVRQVLINHLGPEIEDKVNPEAQLKDDLDADSLDVVETVMDFEEEFGVEITDDEIKDVRTVNDIVEFLKTQKGVTDN